MATKGYVADGTLKTATTTVLPAARALTNVKRVVTDVVRKVPMRGFAPLVESATNARTPAVQMGVTRPPAHVQAENVPPNATENSAVVMAVVVPAVPAMLATAATPVVNVSLGVNQAVTENNVAMMAVAAPVVPARTVHRALMAPAKPPRVHRNAMARYAAMMAVAAPAVPVRAGSYATSSVPALMNQSVNQAATESNVAMMAVAAPVAPVAKKKAVSLANALQTQRRVVKASPLQVLVRGISSNSVMIRAPLAK